MSADTTVPTFSRARGFAPKPSSITSNPDSRFDVSWRYGVTEGGEALVRQICGEIDNEDVHIEVKRKRRNDSKFYVELQHDPGQKGKCIPSGLSVTKAEFWAFVIADTGIVLMARTALLETAIERNYGLPANEKDGTCPTRGRLLDMWDLLIASKPGASSRAAFGDSSFPA